MQQSSVIVIKHRGFPSDMSVYIERYRRTFVDCAPVQLERQFDELWRPAAWVSLTRECWRSSAARRPWYLRRSVSPKSRRASPTDRQLTVDTDTRSVINIMLLKWSDKPSFISLEPGSKSRTMDKPTNLLLRQNLADKTPVQTDPVSLATMFTIQL